MGGGSGGAREKGCEGEGLVGEEKIEEDMDDNFTSIHPCRCTGIPLQRPAKKGNGAAAAMEKPAKEYRTRETQTNNHSCASAEDIAIGNQMKEGGLSDEYFIRFLLILNKAAVVAYSVFLLLFLFRFHGLAVESTFVFSAFWMMLRSCADPFHLLIKGFVAGFVIARAEYSLDVIRSMEWNKVSIEFMIVTLLSLVEHLEKIRGHKNRLDELSNRGPKVPSAKDTSSGGLLLFEKQAASPLAQRSTHIAATT